MEPKKVFLFVFIFLINTKILISSEDYGSISLTFEGTLSSKPSFGGEDLEIGCTDSDCTITFKNDFKDFTNFFANALEPCSNIKTIDLSNLKIIPSNLKGMFSECTGLEKIEGLSKLNTKDVADMSHMFSRCESLSEIDLSNFDTSSVTDMSNMFYFCQKLKTIDLSNFDTSSVKNMTFMFFQVFAEIINVTNFKTSLVEDMSLMFAKEIDFEMLKVINGESSPKKQEIIGLADFDTSKVNNMECIFVGLVGLSSLDLSNFDTSSLQNMEIMFLYCISLKSLDISNFNLNSLNYESLFYYDKLKYINIYNVIYSSDSGFLKQSSIKDSIDEGLIVCQKEKIIEGDKVTSVCCLFNVENLRCEEYLKVKYGKNIEYKNGFIKNDKGEENKYRTNIDYILNGENKVSTEDSLIITADSEIRIYFNENNKGIEHFFDSEYDPNVESITFIDLSNLLSDNLSKTNSLFKGCISLKSINLTFQNKVSLTNMDSMFSGCSSLESIDFSYINTSSIISMDSVFSGCSLLKKINLSDINVKSLTSMNSMFKNCNSLEEIILPEFNSNKEIDISFMFYGCSSFKSLNFSGFNKLIISKMESMFSGCKSIEFLNLSEFKTVSVNNMSCIFEGCISLKNIILSNWDTSNVVDMNSMFAGCSALEDINISYFKTTSLADISKMFYNCQKLKSINLSTFDTKYVKYMDQLFYNCSALEILDIKNFDLTSIESFDSIFTKMNSILYIDLMNLKNEINIWESLDKKETFYICQIRIIIQNPYAFNCCEFMTNPDKCNYFPSTQLMVGQTTEISNTNTPISPIISTFSRPITGVDLILTLFTDWKKIGNNCSFYIHFTSRTKDYIYPTILNVTAIFNYYGKLRNLEETKGICTLKENGMNSNAKYLCEFKVDNLNIKNFKLLANFDFNSKDNINLIMSPIAKMFINNIQDVKDEFNNFSDAPIYILDHCIKIKYQKNLMNISGEIEDPQPNFKTMDIILIINFYSEIEQQTEINCTFTDIKVKNYSLNCRINEDLKGDFQSAISFIGDDILITYFDSFYESTVEETEKKQSIKYHINKKNKQNAGLIVAIVLPFIVCIGIIIGIFIFLKKKNKKQNVLENPTVKKLDV